MNILLCGEYSGVHAELAAALKELGHQVTVLSSGDGYKQLPADIKLAGREYKRVAKLYAISLRLLDIVGIAGLRNFLAFKSVLLHQRFDVVQLINPVSVDHFGALGNYFLIRSIIKKTDNIFLCALGDDARWVYACLTGKFKYSAMDRLSFSSIDKYYYSLKYLFSPAYFLLSKYVESRVKCVIAGLDDYRISYLRGPRYVKKINLPVGGARFRDPDGVHFDRHAHCDSKRREGKVVTIFHAWQKGKEFRKGNDLLDEAVERIRSNPSYNVSYEVASGKTFSEFVSMYEQCDIFLDQVYSYDRGMSAALAMCAGKVVFSGFELSPKFGNDSPDSIRQMGVNATPDVDDLAVCLDYLINNPTVRNVIGRNAYEYARRRYDARTVAEEYLLTWRKWGSFVRDST